MTNHEKTSVSRRTFVKGSALAGLGAAAMGTASLFGCAPAAESTGELAETGETVADTIVWTHCAVNCGSCCALQCHVQDGEIKYVESDNTGSAELGEPQLRACLRGRSLTAVRLSFARLLI